MEPPSWDQFIALFEQKYFPSSLREKKHQEFLDLIQGNMHVSEYRTQFMQLLRFAKGEFPSEKMLKRRFENGLRDNIKIQLVVVPTNTVAECVGLAMEFERMLNEVRARSQ